jgi:hypothetical protein
LYSHVHEIRRYAELVKPCIAFDARRKQVIA